MRVNSCVICGGAVHLDEDKRIAYCSSVEVEKQHSAPVLFIRYEAVDWEGYAHEGKVAKARIELEEALKHAKAPQA